MPRHNNIATITAPEILSFLIELNLVLQMFSLSGAGGQGVINGGKLFLRKAKKRPKRGLEGVFFNRKQVNHPEQDEICTSTQSKRRVKPGLKNDHLTKAELYRP